MHFRILAVALLLFGTTLWADDAADRAKLSGTWQLENGNESWSFIENGDMMHVTYMQGDQKIADFECNTLGRDCETKVAGHNAKISMWFSGPKLVEMETKGSDVLQHRFQVTAQGMQVETAPIVPSGNTETQQFKRSEVTTSSR